MARSQRRATRRKPPTGSRGPGPLVIVAIVVAALVAAALVAAAFVVLVRRGGDGAAPAAATSPTPTSTPSPTDSQSEQPTTSVPAASTPAGKPVLRTYKGSGTKVVTIKKPAQPGDPVLVIASHPVSGKFGIVALDPAQQERAILVNVSGKYQGTTLLDAQGTQTSRLKVKAQGRWTIKIKSVAAARKVESSAKGSDDDVLLYTGIKGVATFDFRGKLNFLVQYATGDPFVNEIGRFHGDVPIKAGPVLIAIRADGTWSMQVQP